MQPRKALRWRRKQKTNQALRLERKGAPWEERDLSSRLSLSEAQLRQLLALCGASLVETMRAAEELSHRVTLLREALEIVLAEGRPNGSVPAMQIVDVRDIMGAASLEP
jgi:hypothetical protein